MTGPFDVAPEVVERLGTSFAQFVNSLLETQVRTQRIAGHQLAITNEENTTDGGVDAALRGATESDWLPAGASAWQFKRSPTGPKAAEEEFDGATWAHEIVRNGGTYVLVIAVQLTDNRLGARQKAIFDRAVALGLLGESDRERIRVYDANKLARWASQLPQLALSPLVGGLGGLAMNFDTWAQGRPHSNVFVPDDARTTAIETIRETVRASRVVDIRVQGDSGIGKTRLVLEALRDDQLSPLVVYLPDERSVGGELFAHFASGSRTAILVVDECPPDRHVKLLELLPEAPEVRLVTLGEVGTPVTNSPVVSVGAMPEQTVEEFLRGNYQLSPEARRFVTHVCEGNVRYAIVLADRILGLPEAQAAEVVQRGDLESILAALLPEGQDFFFAAALALLERIGWERELAPQVEVLAQFVGTSSSELQRVGRDLEARGLLLQQGRYRAVTPHPLAVFLAASAWRRDGDRIVSELLPALDQEMALALFRRVADLGRFEPARSVLPQLLSEEGPFGSLDGIEAGNVGPLLTQLAIVLPDEMARHLGELIENESIDRLQEQRRSRRDLVWTLEKLAWHRHTFVSAANSLLRLALAENETWANNATATWVELFGTMLPGTAAIPQERLGYLAEVAETEDAQVRRFAVRGATRALTPHESIAVSGEVQGGVLVEPRGTPPTFGDAAEYRRAAIELLRLLASDPDPETAGSAEDALIDAMHPLLDDPHVGSALSDALGDLSGDALRRLRIEVQRLLSLHERAERGNSVLRERLQALLAELPEESVLEQLDVLVRLPRWDLGQSESRSRIADLVGRLAQEDELDLVFSLLSDDVPAAFELGLALGQTTADVMQQLVGVFDLNSPALIGYLRAQIDRGNESAFDEFLDSELAGQLPPLAQLWVAARGPATSEARRRLLDGVRELSVVEGTNLLFGWQENLSAADQEELIALWLERTASQEDFDALVEKVAHWLHGEARPDWLSSRGLDVVLLRRSYPKVIHQGYSWSRIALPLVDQSAVAIGKLILDINEGEDAGGLLGHDYDTEVLGACFQRDPEAMWEDVAQRLAAGSWRVELGVRGWLLHSVPVPLIERWVGTDVERARVVASIAPVGDGDPTAAVRFLLDRFGTDQEVASGLYSTYISGGWTGNESDRLTRKIEQLTAWRNRSSEPRGVRDWARKVIEMLERQRTAALEREAERGY